MRCAISTTLPQKRTEMHLTGSHHIEQTESLLDSFTKASEGPARVPLRKIVIVICTILILIFTSAMTLSTISAVDSATDPIAKKKLLFAFISIGPYPARNDAIRQNMNQVLDFKRNSSDRYDVECVIFSRMSRTDTPDFALHPTDCRTVYLPNARYTDHLYHLDPAFLKEAGYDYVTLSLDDVLIYPPSSNLDLGAYFDTVVSSNLSMSSPLIPGSPHHWMNRKRESVNASVGHTAPFVEIQFTTFTMDAWGCIYGLLDLEITFYWFDVFFHEYCFAKGRVAGVLDGFSALHNVTVSTYTQNMGHAEFMAKWKVLHNETLVSNWGQALDGSWKEELFDREGKVVG